MNVRAEPEPVALTNVAFWENGAWPGHLDLIIRAIAAGDADVVGIGDGELIIRRSGCRRRGSVERGDGWLGVRGQEGRLNGDPCRRAGVAGVVADGGGLDGDGVGAVAGVGPRPAGRGDAIGRGRRRPTATGGDLLQRHGELARRARRGHVRRVDRLRVKGDVVGEQHVEVGERRVANGHRRGDVHGRRRVVGKQPRDGERHAGGNPDLAVGDDAPLRIDRDRPVAVRAPLLVEIDGDGSTAAKFGVERAACTVETCDDQIRGPAAGVVNRIDRDDPAGGIDGEFSVVVGIAPERRADDSARPETGVDGAVAVEAHEQRRYSGCRSR